MDLREKHKKPLNVINQRIKRIRRKKKITQGEMADLLGMNERTYSDKESLTQMNGFFDRELLEIAEILDLSIGALVMGDDAESTLRSIQLIVAAHDGMEEALADLRDKALRYDQ
tara:strand:+ start:104 stop:445 length:342 start_codon:yes stop_codon:yes gene_type:complete